ncbi:MAG: copper ion binding protein, partial [Chloroflexi bacterium]
MSQTAIEPATHPANAHELAFDVTGMTCASCVRRIEKALRRVDGVEQAAVNLATEKATIRYDATRTGMDQLKSAVEHAGYGVRQLPAPPDAPAPTAAPGEVVLPIEGMTCASCVRRIEKRLSRVDGVSQTNVNLATEQAHVVFDPALVDVQALTAAVEQAGYKVGALAAPAAGRPAAAAESAEQVDQHALERQREIDDLRVRWQVALPVGLAMMALMYLPLGIPMEVLAPVLLIAATIVQFWAGRVFYQAAWAAARHGSTNMNTLVA